MPVDVDPDRLRRCYARARELLLAERTPGHYWVGELSTSALSTATAVMALLQVGRGSGGGRPGRDLESLICGGLRWLVAHQNSDGGWGDTVKSFSNISTTMLCHAVLVAVGQETGLWNDANRETSIDFIVRAAQQYIDRAGGVPALVARYGQDKTFSIPILTHCALAGIVDWRQITPLPFELACLPAKFYKTVRLPVVSYALPALIAIGQVRHHFAPTWNPLTRVLRNLSIEPSLRVLERIQPSNGGFLEATPLTSFVTMSLAAIGRVEHPVVKKGVEFISNAVRPDGSWPIDTNLSTWVTTLAVNALGDDLPEESRVPLLNWLLDQQYREVHPYTNADPGGWAWTNLPGGVPDADDTPGAMLAILELTRQSRTNQSRDRKGAREPAPEFDTGDSDTESVGRDDSRGASNDVGSVPRSLPDGRGSDGALSDGRGTPRSQAPAWERTRPDAPLRPLLDGLLQQVDDAVRAGMNWLLGLQNRDGGHPTFCRGWGRLPFDRSSPDITAHALRVFAAHAGEWLFREDDCDEMDIPASIADGLVGMHRGLQFLTRVQNGDGSWLPLWFGNQHAPGDINPTYGTAKVLAAYRDCRMFDKEPAQRGMAWLRENPNPDGGWGAGPGTPSSVEETALAVEALLDDPHASGHVSRGLDWLMQRVEAVDDAPGVRDDPQQPKGLPRTILDPAPIGFYFAKLWYFERLYPLIFAVSCLRRAVKSITEQGERRA